MCYEINLNDKLFFNNGIDVVQEIGKTLDGKKIIISCREVNVFISIDDNKYIIDRIVPKYILHPHGEIKLEYYIKNNVICERFIILDGHIFKTVISKHFTF